VNEDKQDKSISRAWRENFLKMQWGGIPHIHLLIGDNPEKAKRAVLTEREIEVGRQVNRKDN
jgi:hypothetical protein